MSVIDDLKRKVQSLDSQLSLAKKCLHAAMVDAEPLKVGDIVEVTTPGWSGGKVQVEVGRVRNVFVRYGDVRVEIAPKTKSGYHATASISTSHNSTYRKLEAV